MAQEQARIAQEEEERILKALELENPSQADDGDEQAEVTIIPPPEL